VTFVLRTADADVDLGPTLELAASFKKMGQLDPDVEGDRYPQLFFLPQLDQSEPVPTEYVRLVRDQAAAFAIAHGAELDAHTQSILGRLNALRAPQPSAAPLRVVATRGDGIFLLDVGGERGRILHTDMDPPRMWPPQLIESILKFGYWDAFVGDPALVLAAAARADEVEPPL
jgi:hypothetical protein